MKLQYAVAFLLALGATAQVCPNAQITVGGSSTVWPLSVAWTQQYKTTCPNTNIVVEEPLGSSAGARKVCDVSTTGEDAVHVGDMSRPWKDEEATTENNYLYECVGSDREVIQIDVAIDGLSIVTAKTGAAAECIEIIGGLTVPQLRWIYSDQTFAQLVENGLPANTLAASDNNDNTHLWSELDSACAAVEILISGADIDSGTYDYFKEVAFGSDNPDDHPFGGRQTSDGTIQYVNSANDQDLIEYVLNNGAAISYFGYSYAARNDQTISVVPIYNDEAKEFVRPTPVTIFGGDYFPFSRRIYMNVLNEPAVLEAMRPFFVYAFGSAGTQTVEDTGYVPIPEYEQEVMMARIGAGDVDLDSISCGPSGSFTIAGSSTVRPVADIWAGIYQVKCHTSKITVEGGGSSRGAARVCNFGNEPAVDIGNMSRDWRETEATTSNGYEFNCLESPRKVIRIEVAIDGLTVAVKSGSRAERCIRTLSGGGLTIDQLRWIYSSYTEAELEADGWNPNAVPNRDTNPNTHYWSELNDHVDCPATEIMISGADVLSGTHEYFKEAVFNDHAAGETFATERSSANYFNSEEDEDLVNYLAQNDVAISYFGYAYFAQNEEDLVAVKIRNSEGNYIMPSDVSVQDGTYNPLARRIYMNLLDDDVSLSQTRPFINFGLSTIGEGLVEFTGYSPIPPLERIIMNTRAQTESGIPLSQIQNTPCGPAGQTIKIAGSSTVFPVAELWSGIYEVGCNVNFVVEGGGSSVGAERVCSDDATKAVDIGDMSRGWRDTEAKVRSDGYTYDCVGSSRSAIQMHVAIDGLTVAVERGSIANDCIDRLGGLTLDQLRWIYSSYTHDQLEADGWDPTSLANSDGNDNTHKWIELHEDCEDVEIEIAGADDLSGTQEYFKEAVLTDEGNGEDFDRDRSVGYFNSALDEDLVAYLQENPGAIAYFGYAYYFANRDTLYSSPIKNSQGSFVRPDETSVNNGTYEPLARRIFMNLYNNENSLENTVPFLRFGYSDEGLSLVSETGYVAIPETGADSVETFTNLLDSASSGEVPDEDDDDDSGVGGGAIAAIIIGAMVAVVIVLVIVMRGGKSEIESGGGVGSGENA